MPNLDVMFGTRVLPPKFWQGAFFSPYSPYMTKSWTPSPVSNRPLSSEESWEAGSLLILWMFWYFGLDLRWTIQASGKYQADCKILALLLRGITWVCLGASLKALNAFHPAAMPLFPGAGLSVKPKREKMKNTDMEETWLLRVCY